MSLRPTCRVVAVRLAGVDAVDELGERLSGHVATCLRCQVEAARYRTLQRRLGALADRPQQAPAGFVASVMRRLSDPVEVLSPRRRHLLPSRATVTAAATGAAVVATAGTLAVLLRRLHPPI